MFTLTNIVFKMFILTSNVFKKYSWTDIVLKNVRFKCSETFILTVKVFKNVYFDK